MEGKRAAALSPEQAECRPLLGEVTMTKAFRSCNKYKKHENGMVKAAADRLARKALDVFNHDRYLAEWHALLSDTV